MEVKNWKSEAQEQILFYLSFLSKRANGTIPTDAKFIRDFVTQHTAYEKDSIVNNEVCFDLLKMLEDLANDASSARKALLTDEFA